MKVTFILDNYPPHFGGAERVFEQIVNHLAKKDIQIRVVTTSNTSETKIVKKENIEIFYYPWTMIMDHPIPRMKDMVEHVKWADIVHTATYSVSRVALYLAKKHNKPCVLTPFEALKSKWYWVISNPILATLFLLFERLSVKAAFDHFHVISQATGRDVISLGIDPQKVTTAYPGINYTIWNSEVKPANVATYLGYDEDKKIILYYGRPGKPKGIFVLLEAIRLIKDQIPEDIKFGFIMPREPSKVRKKFEDMALSYGLEDILKIGEPVPWEPDENSVGIENYVKSAFFVVVPSLTEGFGFCAAETCALEVPLIASDAGSLPEVVSGKHLFFENQSSKMLSEQILKGIKGEFNESPKRTFKWDDCVNEIEKIYTELVT